VASCALAGAIAVPDVAVAAGVSPIDATAEQRKLATDHFAQGKQALAVGNLEKAIEELRASLDVVDSPNAHLELARALRDSGNPAEAWLEYGRAVAVATQLAPKEERYAKTGEAASNERVDVEGKLGFVAVTVTRAPDGASLHVGGRVVAPEEWNAPVPVTPGSFDVVLLDIGGAEIARRTVSVAIGQTVPVSLDVVPAPPAKASADVSDDEMPSSAASPPPPEVPPPRPSDPTRWRPLAYFAGGIGVLGVASFVVFGVMSNTTYHDLENTCPRGCPPSKHGEIDNGMTEQTVANVSLAVGAVGLAAGATIFVLSLPAPSTVRASLVVAPVYQGGYVGVRGSL
jgi:hypothetical protein